MEKDKEFTVARLILRMANQIVKNRNLHVKALGLTTEQADSLLFFLSHENAVINDLKDYLCVTHQTARGIVQRMEGKGVVTTRKSPTDGRYQVVSLSEKGRKMGAILLENGIQTGSRLLHGMTPEQEDLFLQLMQMALENVENHPISSGEGMLPPEIL